MENKIFNLNGNVYIFSNETQATRNGFRHVSYLSLNDFPVSSAKCDYLNRTWETYRYQTSMLKAVRELIYERRMTIKNDFMELTGYKKMTAKRNDEFEAICENDETLKEYAELEKQLGRNW